LPICSPIPPGRKPDQPNRAGEKNGIPYPDARIHASHSGRLQECVPAVRQCGARSHASWWVSAIVPVRAPAATTSTMPKSSANNAATAPHPQLMGTIIAVEANASDTNPRIQAEGARR
jgi:hypothetical protein